MRIVSGAAGAAGFGTSVGFGAAGTAVAAGAAGAAVAAGAAGAAGFAVGAAVGCAQAVNASATAGTIRNLLFISSLIFSF